MAYVIFDTETTGLHPELGDRMIEIAAVRVMNGKIRDEVFHSLINPGRQVSFDALKVHGITQEMLDQAPGAAVVIPQFLIFLGSDVLVAHNAPFDMGFLKKELELLGIPLEKLPSSICTLKQVQKELPDLPHHNLDAIAQFFGIPVGQRHRALDDAKILAEVFIKIHREEPMLF